MLEYVRVWMNTEIKDWRGKIFRGWGTMIGSFLEQGHTIKRETQSSLKHKAGRAPLWGLHFSTRIVLVVPGATDKSPALLLMATGFPTADCRQRIRGVS